MATINGVVLSDLQKALVHRAVNTEINLLTRLYGHWPEGGTAFEFESATFAEQVEALKAVEDALYPLPELCIADCGCAGGQEAAKCTFYPACPRCIDNQGEPEEPMPCPVPTCNVEGLNDPEALQDHIDNEHTLEERRALIIQEIVTEVEVGDAPIFTRNDLVKFFNWLTTNTDTFDKVMISIERDLGEDHTLSADLVEDLVLEFAHIIEKE